MAEDIATVVTRREALDRQVTAVTPQSVDANVRVKPLPWYVMISVRAARVYIMSLLAVLGADAFGAVSVAPAGEFLALLQRAATMALAPAVVSLIWNAGELLARLDVTLPEIRA